MAAALRRPQTPGITTAEALVQLADKCALDLLFMGTHGRKGPKSALGSTANAAMRQSACSVCLAQRPTSHDVASKRKWVVAVDGGRASLMGEAWVAWDGCATPASTHSTHCSAAQGGGVTPAGKRCDAPCTSVHLLACSLLERPQELCTPRRHHLRLDGGLQTGV